MTGKADIVVVAVLLAIGVIALMMVGFGWWDDILVREASELSR